MSAAAMPRLEPIGWVVESAKGRALVLERPAADAMAAKVHGTVDAAYSGAQLAWLLAQANTATPIATTAPEAPHAAA